MTAHLAEVRVRHDPAWFYWRVEVFPMGKRTAPYTIERRMWKSTCMALARGHQRRLWVDHGQGSELIEFNRKGQIVARATYPREADPKESKG